MKKMILIAGIAMACIAVILVKKGMQKPVTETTYTIGILQTASHPSLDAARDGFIEELKSRLGDTVAFTIQNAQGSVAHAHAIAQQFHANKKLNGVYAIATPAAQAMSSLEKEKPIFIAAVTDPDDLGLISSTTNVCGTKDMIDTKAEIEMLISLIPDVKTVGLLYTAGETNSIEQVMQMRQELEARGLRAIDFGVSNESDVQVIVDLACRKVDVILVPTDNTVASAITLIATIALKYKKPLIASFNSAIKDGALAAQGIDYAESGKQTAQIAYEVMVNGKKPYELPIKQAEGGAIVINGKTLEALGLSIPEVLQEQVILI